MKYIFMCVYIYIYIYTRCVYVAIRRHVSRAEQVVPSIVVPNSTYAKPLRAICGSEGKPNFGVSGNRRAECQYFWRPGSRISVFPEAGRAEHIVFLFLLRPFQPRSSVEPTGEPNS